MATQSQIKRLSERIDAVVAKHRPPIEYEVILVWMQDDGSVLDSNGQPYVPGPDVISLDFDDQVRR